MAKISILIAVYNGAESFEKSIGCLMRQTLQDIEIVCVNDNSTDNSLELLEAYKEKDDRIKIVSFKENRGTICARKAGVEAATGEYIMFMDQDDEFEIYACEELYNMIEEKQVDILNFRSRVIAIPPTTEKQREWQENFMAPYDGFLYGDDVFNYCFNPDYESGVTWNKYTWNVWNKIYKAEVCKKAMLECAEDYVVNGDDMYIYMLISYYAKSYFGDANGKYYHIYSYGTGLMGAHKLSLKRYYTIARRGKSVDNEYEFFKDKDIEKYSEAIKLDFARAICGIVQRWYSRLEENDRPSGYDMMHEYMKDVEVISGLQKHVNVSKEQLIGAIKGAKTTEVKKVYIKTVVIYFSDSDDSYIRIGRVDILNMRKAGYKVICITDENHNIDQFVPENEEVIFIPKQMEKTNVIEYAIRDREEKIKEVILDNHADAYVYAGKINECQIYDMLIVKGNGTVYIHYDSQLAELSKTEGIQEHKDYVAMLDFSDGVIAGLSVIKEYTNSIRTVTVPEENITDIFTEVFEMNSNIPYEINALLEDKSFRKYCKKRAIHRMFKAGSIKVKLKIIIKKMLSCIGIKKNYYCDEYDDYLKIKKSIRR